MSSGVYAGISAKICAHNNFPLFILKMYDHGLGAHLNY